MNSSRMVALVLIIAGALGLAYGGFTYTRDRHHTKIGPVEVSVKEKQHVNIPVWAGAGAILVGGLMFGFAGKRV